MKNMCVAVTLAFLVTVHVAVAEYGGNSAGGQAMWDSALEEELVWGNTFRGVGISLRPKKARYMIGEDVEVMVFTKNFGEDEASLIWIGGSRKIFRLALFDADGRPVAKSELAEELEYQLGRPPTGRFSPSAEKIGPGELAPGYRVISVNDWFRIEKAGTYSLVVVRLALRDISSCDTSIFISNEARIVIANGEDPATLGQHHKEVGRAIPEQNRFEAGMYVAIGGVGTLLIVGGITLVKKTSKKRI